MDDNPPPSSRKRERLRGEEYISESRKKGGSLMFQFLCFVVPWLLGVELKGNHPATLADALNRHIEQVAREGKLMGLKTRQPRGSNTRSIDTAARYSKKKDSGSDGSRLHASTSSPSSTSHIPHRRQP
jgi:hypothetical protein